MEELVLLDKGDLLVLQVNVENLDSVDQVV